MYVTAFNTSSAPVTVDHEGRQISSKDWGTVDTTADPVRAAIDAGRLIIRDDIADNGHPDATAARDRTVTIAQRAEQFNALEKDQLVEIAKNAGVPGAADMHKPQLSHALASRLDVMGPAVSEEREEPPTVIEGEPEEPQGEPGPETKRSSTRHRAGRE